MMKHSQNRLTNIHRRNKRLLSTAYLEYLETRLLMSTGTLDGLLTGRTEVFVPWSDSGGLALEGVYVAKTTSSQDFEDLANQLNLSVEEVVDLGDSYFGFYSPETPSVVDGWRQQYSADIEGIDPDFTIHAASVPIPNANQWYLNNTGQTKEKRGQEPFPHLLSPEGGYKEVS